MKIFLLHLLIFPISYFIEQKGKKSKKDCPLLSKAGILYSNTIGGSKNVVVTVSVLPYIIAGYLAFEVLRGGHTDPSISGRRVSHQALGTLYSLDQ